MRGMMWRIGGRVINVLPFTVIILIVIVFVIIAIYKYINGQRH
jgi:RsiW-degrading membrane proteinase PrsW (M82 family)